MRLCDHCGEPFSYCRCLAYDRNVAAVTRSAGDGQSPSTGSTGADDFALMTARLVRAIRSGVCKQQIAVAEAAEDLLRRKGKLSPLR